MPTNTPKIPFNEASAITIAGVALSPSSFPIFEKELKGQVNDAALKSLIFDAEHGSPREVSRLAIAVYNDCANVMNQTKKVSPTVETTTTNAVKLAEYAAKQGDLDATLLITHILIQGAICKQDIPQAERILLALTISPSQAPETRALAKDWLTSLEEGLRDGTIPIRAGSAAAVVEKPNAKPLRDPLKDVQKEIGLEMKKITRKPPAPPAPPAV